MTPTLVHVDPFFITGIKTRTNNANEMIPAQAKLSLLWGDFFSQHIADKVNNKVEHSPIYGLYTHYQSDHNGDYDVIAGVQTSQAEKGEYSSIEVQGGNYLLFEATGEMPQVVINLWLSVWHYFEEPQSVTRLYSTDFEVYEQGKVAIYIAVKPRYHNQH